MNKTQLVEKIAAQAGISKAAAKKALDATTGVLLNSNSLFLVTKLKIQSSKIQC